jgi:hypothetical protein
LLAASGHIRPRHVNSAIVAARINGYDIAMNARAIMTICCITA